MPTTPSGANPASEESWAAAKPLLLKWLERSRTNQLQHYKAASLYARANNALGVPVIVFSSIVGTTVFATLQKQVRFGIQLAVGAISVFAAVLAALQTFLRYSEKAEKHRSVAASYGGLRKQIEAIGFIPIESRGSVKEFIDSVRAQFDSLAQGAPSPPESTWKALRLGSAQDFFIPEWPTAKEIYTSEPTPPALSSFPESSGTIADATAPVSEPYRDV